MESPMPRKRALITGGSRGLGLELCRTMIEDGWEVTTASRSLTADLSSLIEASGGRLTHCSVDLGSQAGLATLIREARLIDGVDGFVANAAVGTDGLLTLTSEAEIRRTIEVNLISVLVLARAVIKGMLERGGSLVFVSSVAARTGFSGLSAYSATKGGLVSFSRTVAREYGERGIRSNCVLPGFLETQMSSRLALDQQQRIARRCALGRLGQPGDVTGAVRFLLSEEARYVTGTEMTVDGGLTA